MSQVSDEILSNTDIVDRISRYVPLKRAGANFSGLCPFHNEKSPSFMVSPQKQIFKCFGCGVGGNIITFIKEIEKVEFRDAVKILAKDANIDIQEYQKKSKFYEKYASQKEKIKRIHKLTQEFFLESLKKSELAQKYLSESRKLSPELISEFGIGYAPDSHYELTQFLKSKGFNNDDLVEASIVKKSQNGDVYNFFKNRITFPIYDTLNNVVAYSARILDPKDKPKYLNSSEHAVFEKSKILYGLNLAKKHIKEQEKLIIVEGQMDVIALARIDYPVGVATCGTALTDDHIKLIKRYTNQVYLLFDNDFAGQEATIRALKIAYQQDIFPKIIVLPDTVKDVDDLANEAGGKEIFEQSLNSSKDGFITVFETLQKTLDMSSPIDKQKLFNTMFSLIIGLPNPSTQIHYLGVLADKIGQNYEVINAQYKQYAKGEGKFFIRQQQKQSQESKIYQPERELIIASLVYNNFFKLLVKDTESLEKMSELFLKFQDLFPDSFLAVNTENLDEDQISALEESQLRREKELHYCKDDLEKILVIKRVLQPIFKSKLQQINKLSKISTEEKQAFLKVVRSFLG